MKPYQNLSVETMAGELWKPIPNFKDYYLISSFGRVRAVARVDSNNVYRAERIMKQHINKSGYLYFSISLDAKRKTYLTHRVVATVFHENPEEKSDVNHIDGNKLNANKENLEWSTYMENRRHSISLRLNKNRNGGDTLTESQVLEIFHSPEKAVSVCEKYGIHHVTVSHIRLGISWGWLTGKKYISQDGKRKYLTSGTIKMSYGDVAKKLNCSRAVISYRIKCGWSDADIINTPVNQNKQWTLQV